MRVQFSIYEKNKKTGQAISGSLYVADDEHIFDLFNDLEFSPVNSEFPNLNYLEMGRLIKYKNDTYEVVDFSITTNI